MRVAALYDVHGNLPALEAVLDDVARAAVDLVVLGGDAVPGPIPAETLDRLTALDFPARFIHGNGDREVLAQMTGSETNWYRNALEQWREPVRWSAEQLGAGHRATMAGWPATCAVEIDAVGEVLFCHATPRNDTDTFTRLTPEERLLPIFSEVEADLVVVGHTHMQFDRTIGGTRVVNAGSVGMPFGEPGAYWLLVGPHVELRFTAYDLERAAERIMATGYPQAEEFATHSVLRPPAEDESLEMFSRVELA